MTPKLSNLNIVLGYWNENMNQNFRFNNPKQCSNWIILVSFCSSHLAIKSATMFILWKFKKSMQKSIKNSKKFVYYNEELVHKFKISNAIISKTTTIQNMPHFSWSFRIYHFLYGCNWLDWSFNSNSITAYTNRKFSDFFETTL